MILDTSALIAILSNEPERSTFTEAIERAPCVLISSGTYLEVSIVIGRKYGHLGLGALRELLLISQVRIVPFDEAQSSLATIAYERYGRGNHPAGLNFGDCFAYALAKNSGDTLLFKGEDFSLTDIVSAV